MCRKVVRKHSIKPEKNIKSQIIFHLTPWVAELFKKWYHMIKVLRYTYIYIYIKLHMTFLKRSNHRYWVLSRLYFINHIYMQNTWPVIFELSVYIRCLTLDGIQGSHLDHITLRDCNGILLFEGIVVSQKLRHRKISIFFLGHLLGYSIRWNNKNFSEQRNDVTKKVNLWLVTCKTPMPKLLFFIKS